MSSDKQILLLPEKCSFWISSQSVTIGAQGQKKIIRIYHDVILPIFLSLNSPHVDASNIFKVRRECDLDGFTVRRGWVVGSS